MLILLGLLLSTALLRGARYALADSPLYLSLSFFPIIQSDLPNANRCVLLVLVPILFVLSLVLHAKVLKT